MTKTRATLLGICLALAGASAARAASGIGGQPAADLTADTRPVALRGVGIDQHLGDAVPLDVVLRDESGKALRLGEYFGGKPVLLSLNYFHCPMLCPLVFEGLVRSLRPLSMDVGKEFTIVTVSIDPRESAAQAAEKKRQVIGSYARPGAAEGWHFLTGDRSSIDRLTEAVGFHYRYDADRDEYAHAAALVVLTPDGRISRYLYGVDYAPRDVRLALVEASGNRIGTLADQLLLFCFHYDAAAGKYGAATLTAVRIGGIITVLGIAGFVISQGFRNKSGAGRSRAAQAQS